MVKNRTPWDDINFHILTHFEKALIDSFAELSDVKSSWLTPSVWLGCIGGRIWESYPQDQITNSLACMKLMEWQRSVLWMYLAAYSGAYESIGRELRFIIEDVCQSLMLDSEYTQEKIEEKIKKISKKISGSQLVDKLVFQENLDNKLRRRFKRDLKKLLKIFNHYVHPSKSVVEKSVTDGKIIFKLNRDQFKELLELFSKTMDLVVAIILARYPDAIENFLEYQIFDTAVKYTLYHSNYCNTFDVCVYYSPETFQDSYFGYQNYDDTS